MSGYIEELNNISRIVMGRALPYKNSDEYYVEINSLIESVGLIEFFLKASAKVKAELLASSNKDNFENLFVKLNDDFLIEILASADLSQVREIFKKALSIEKLHRYIFNEKVVSKISSIDEEKGLLLKGFLNSLKSNDVNYHNNDSINDILSNYNKLNSDYSAMEELHRSTVSELSEKIESLEKKNAEIIQERIDKNLSIYVQDSVGALKDIEAKLKCAAARWSILSVIIIFSGFAAGIGFSLFGYLFGPELKDLRWPELLIFSIKGIFIVSAFVAAAGYSFMKSNAFTHEAIIVSNRAHAIQFGKLYLEIYGNTVERGEMQKIFENWNISSDTAFLRNKNDKSDPVKFSEFLDSLKKVKELIPSIGKE